MMEWAKLSAEVLKSLAWPAVVLILGLLFKSELRSLFPRIRRAGPSGIEFDQERQRIAEPTGKLKDLPGLHRTAKIAEIEKSIHEALGLYDPGKHIDLLVRHLAQARLETIFERIYGTIFGSQIVGLRALANAGGRVSRDHALKFFDDVKSKYPEFYEKATYDEWLAFLKAFALVQTDESGVELTDLGRDFLLYLTAKGLPENKNW